MSKSKGNVVSPDPLIEHYGTDALRGYELFVGPMDLDAEWNPRGINGIHRFLIKLHNLEPTKAKNTATAAKFDQYLTKINDQIANYRLNTYISSAMEFANAIIKSGIDEETFGKFIVTLSPVFPYLCEELWEKLGHNTSVFSASWPRSSSHGKQSVEIWKLLKNQKFVKNFEVPAGELPSEELIQELQKALGVMQAKHFANSRGKVLNIIVP
jgi:leucyl-tRNA synthetase